MRVRSKLFGLTLWVASFMAASFVGACASSSDRLLAHDWAAACGAIDPDGRDRVLGWMWATQDLQVRGRALTADEVRAELGAAPHDYGERFVVVELSLTVAADGVFVHAVTGGGLRDVRARMHAMLSGRSSEPPRPLLPPGPFKDEAAGAADFHSEYIKPLLVEATRTLVIPEEVAGRVLRIDASGTRVLEAASLFVLRPERDVQVGVFSDAVLLDEEWVARARVRADDYIARLVAHERNGSARAAAIEEVTQRVVASRRCRATAGTVCRVLTVVERPADRRLVIDLDAELADKPGCYPRSNLVAPLAPDVPLPEAVAAAIARLKPEAAR